jgi:hypothetical protein
VSIHHTGGICVPQSNCKNCLTGHANVPNQCPQPPNILCGVYQSAAAGAEARACQDTDSKDNSCNPNGTGTYDCGDSKAWYCGCANADGSCGFVSCECDDDDPADFTGNPPAQPTCV